MINVTIHTADKKITKTFDAPVLLADALSHTHVSYPCGKKGICGKCRVQARGALNSPGETERARLSSADLAEGFRLACLCRAIGDCDIYYTTETAQLQGVTSGFMPDFVKNPHIDSGFGCAVDVGTTTIAAYLYDMADCALVDSVCVPNPQAQFGADVISRIEASGEHADELASCVCGALSEIARGFGHTPDVWVITGNTTMLHLLCSLDASGIAAAPFLPKDYFGKWIENAYLPPCVSAYVGADITCAMLSCSVTEKNGSLLVDVGTNGEMALFANGKLVCCSTAAGPAFEGVGIRMGMAASPGAISRVYIEDGEIRYETVGGAKAVGICGTGLIDAVACMLTLGVIDESGYLEDDFYLGDSSVCITPSDVRQVQLAKAAISAGIDTLLSHCGVAPDEVSSFYIAGGFGQYLDPESCRIIGMFPKSLAKIAKPVGNAAGAGACMILQSKDATAAAEKLSQKAETIELSESACFMDRYVENMMFKGETI